jgi:nitroreductase
MLVLLTAIDEGLAAAFTGHPEQEERLRQILGLPDDVVPIGVAFVGYPAPDPKSDTASSRFREQRRPLGDVVHWERWS